MYVMQRLASGAGSVFINRRRNRHRPSGGGAGANALPLCYYQTNNRITYTDPTSCCTFRDFKADARNKQTKVLLNLTLAQSDFTFAIYSSFRNDNES